MMNVRLDTVKFLDTWLVNQVEWLAGDKLYYDDKANS